MKSFTLTFAALLAFLQFSIPLHGQEKLDEDRFQELMNSTVPKEQLSQIDWQTDLLDAQKIALEQKKPIFIWSMDGNPLGCT